jgi:hypothetical protein
MIRPGESRWDGLRSVMFAIFVIILSLALFIFYWDAMRRLSLYRVIRRVVSGATTELLVVDPDVERILWGLLSSIPPSSWSPNGKHLAVLRSRSRSDIILLRASKR